MSLVEQQGAPTTLSPHEKVDTIQQHKEHVDETGSVCISDDTFSIKPYKPNCRHCRDLLVETSLTKLGASPSSRHAAHSKPVFSKAPQP